MQTVRTPDLELAQVWLDSDPIARLRVNFPINVHSGTRDSAVVYFEIEPGDRLGRHTDSAEEILYVVTGEGEAEAGEEYARVSAGDLAVIPAMVPHGIRNVGDETLRVVGFFSESRIISTFEEPVQPVGQSALEQGAPAPVEA
jgi:quercetin dioxygenase-like cupin family protein